MLRNITDRIQGVPNEQQADVPHSSRSPTERCQPARTASIRAPQKPSDVVRVGVIGYGYWGPNIVRNLHGLDNCERGRGVRQEPDGAAARQRAPIRAST